MLIHCDTLHLINLLSASNFYDVLCDLEINKRPH